MADIRTMGTAVEAYSTDKNAYPSVNSVEELRPLLVPTYVRTLPAHDGWNGEYRYECVETKDGVCSRYAIASGGKDQRFERSALREYLGGAAGATSNFDCDVVYSNGEFVEYPEGTQR
jgi:general secretion pathway protein G